MEPADLKDRTKKFALRVITATQAIPSTAAARDISNQRLRAATSVGANYRAACRARSRADFISKLGIAIEEADESLYWMELLVEADMRTKAELASLMREAGEIVAILTVSAKTARDHLRLRDSR